MDEAGGLWPKLRPPSGAARAEVTTCEMRSSLE